MKTMKNQTIFFVMQLFLYFHFFSVSPKLANIRFDFAHNFEYLNFFVLFWKYEIYCKKNQDSIFYIICTTELRKSYVYRKGVARLWASTVHVQHILYH